MDELGKKIDKRKTELLELRKKKKAQREKKRRADAKNREKDIIHFLKECGYSSLKYENHAKIMDFLKKNETEIKTIYDDFECVDLTKIIF